MTGKVKKTNGGMNIKQRSIILLWFPFSDLSAKKKRPVLVISSDNFNRQSRDLIVCQITSKIDSGLLEYNVPLKNEDLEFGYLRRESVIKPYRIFTANKSLIAPTSRGDTVVGRIKSEKFEEVLNVIKEIIGKEIIGAEEV